MKTKSQIKNTLQLLIVVAAFALTSCEKESVEPQRNFNESNSAKQLHSNNGNHGNGNNGNHYENSNNSTHDGVVATQPGYIFHPFNYVPVLNPQTVYPNSSSIAASYYSVSITNGPNVTGRDVAVSGIASAINYVGQFSQYGLAINWGDGTPQTVYPDLSVLSFINSNNCFSGSWSSTHTYDYPGSYIVKVKLYRGNSMQSPNGLASDTSIATIVCYPLHPPFYAPC